MIRIEAMSVRLGMVGYAAVMKVGDTEEKALPLRGRVGWGCSRPE
jgi:hypothetical protein